jgi:hypothetical protein
MEEFDGRILFLLKRKLSAEPLSDFKGMASLYGAFGIVAVEYFFAAATFVLLPSSVGHEDGPGIARATFDRLLNVFFTTLMIMGYQKNRRSLLVPYFCYATLSSTATLVTVVVKGFSG